MKGKTDIRKWYVETVDGDITSSDYNNDEYFYLKCHGKIDGVDGVFGLKTKNNRKLLETIQTGHSGDGFYSEYKGKSEVYISDKSKINAKGSTSSQNSQPASSGRSGYSDAPIASYTLAEYDALFGHAFKTVANHLSENDIAVNSDSAGLFSTYIISAVKLGLKVQAKQVAKAPILNADRQGDVDDSNLPF